MSYQYDATPEERAAESLLREKGWGVSEPSCPDCNGFGYLSTTEVWTSGGVAGVLGGGSSTLTPCPRGCQMVAWFFNASAGRPDPVIQRRLDRYVAKAP